MPFSSFISGRLSLRAGHRRWAPAIVVATGGIALSFAVMLVSIAVVTGFKNEIRRKIMGFDAQLTVTPLASYYGEGVTSVVLDSLLRHEILQAVSFPGGGDANVAVSVRQPGLLKTDNDFMGVVFKAFSDGYDWGFERSVLMEGDLPGDSNNRGITVSSTMARKLGIGMGDAVNAYFFIDGTVRPRKFEVTGIYDSNFGEYDEIIVYATKKAIGGLIKYAPDEGQSVEIHGIPEGLIDEVATGLQHRLNVAATAGTIEQSLIVASVYSSGAAYFNWLDMLDTNIVVILILMGCVSGFMLISCVLILILERVRMVGQLKALGATNGQVGMIFVRLGARVTGFGLLIGNVVALSLIGAEYLWKFIPLDPMSYYLSYVPVSLSMVDWALLNGGAALLAFFLMLLPACAVGRLSPVSILRFE